MVQGAATLGSEQMGKSFVLVKMLAATGDGQAGAAEWRAQPRSANSKLNLSARPTQQLGETRTRHESTFQKWR